MTNKEKQLTARAEVIAVLKTIRSLKKSKKFDVFDEGDVMVDALDGAETHIIEALYELDKELIEDEIDS